MTIAKKIETKIATNNSKVDTANKTARLAELKAEYDKLTDALLNDENISDSRDSYLRKLRTDVRNEISELEAAIETENNTAAATTYTTKVAKNGAINFYNVKTGKRVKEADVVMDAIENGGTFYTAHVHGYDVDHICTKEFASPITAYKWICRMARKNTTYADGDAQIIVGFNGEEIYTQKMSTAAIKNDELRAYVEAEDAPYVAESIKQEREGQIRMQMSHRNITREQAEELVDYIRANREHYNSEVRNTVKAMLDNYKKINNTVEAATAEEKVEPATVETESKDDEITLAEAKLFSAKVRGLSFTDFLAEEAGMTAEEYAAKEDAERINLAKRELSQYVDEQKAVIRDLEYDLYQTARALYGTVNADYYEGDDEMKAYAIELETEYNDLTAKIATCKAELATVKAAIAADKNINAESPAPTDEPTTETSETPAPDTPEQVVGVITALRDAIKRGDTQFIFPTANQPAEPAIDKAQIEDSLTRAMETALEHYKGFCHIGNLTKAEHELKLYEICRKATRELWED